MPEVTSFVVVRDDLQKGRFASERWLKVARRRGGDAVERVYLDALNGRVAPDCGNILSLS
jgi:hypothetical protein